VQPLLPAGVFGDPTGAERRAERLWALAEQRMLLRGLRDEVDLASASIASADLDDSWQSDAHRGYTERLGELAGDLCRAGRQLDDALDAVHTAMSRLAAG